MQTKAAKNILESINGAIYEFEGDLTRLERAIGMYFVGKEYGWRVMLLIHDKKTIRQYEEILGIDIRKEFPERGPLAHQSQALKIADKVGNFWKVVRGGVKGGRTPDVTQ